MLQLSPASCIVGSERFGPSGAFACDVTAPDAKTGAITEEVRYRRRGFRRWGYRSYGYRPYGTYYGYRPYPYYYGGYGGYGYPYYYRRRPGFRYLPRLLTAAATARQKNARPRFFFHARCAWCRRAADELPVAATPHGR